MKCLLLVLGLALVCGMRAIDVPQTMKDLDIQKLAGIWHSMAVVASDPSIENILLKMHVKSLELTPEGSLEIILNKREGNSCSCVERSFTAEKTENPAEFNLNYLGQNKVFLLDTDYDSYLLLCLESTSAPQQSLVCQYLDRTLKAQDNVMAEFHKVIRTLPLPMPVFLDLSQVEGQCCI